MFKQGKKLQNNNMALSNMFGNRFNGFVNNYNKKDVIYYHLTSNLTSRWMLNMSRNSTINHLKIEKRDPKNIKVAGNFQMKK